MLMTGRIEIHKTDGVVRHCEAVLKLDDGYLAVYDSLPATNWEVQDGMLLDVKTGNIIEPHILAPPEAYERVERENKYWKNTSPEAITQRAKERDDADESELTNI